MNSLLPRTKLVVCMLVVWGCMCGWASSQDRDAVSQESAVPQSDADAARPLGGLQGKAVEEEGGAAEAQAQAGDEDAREGVPQPDSVFQRQYRKALVVDVRGPIFAPLRAYVENRLEKAQREDVDLLILRITSPGGDMTDSLELATRLSEIDWATVVAFVPDEAISGAAILSLGCERIFMRPRASIGDAGPIQFHGGKFEHAEEKIVSFLANELRILAESRGRPAAIAEAMADRNLEVFSVTNKTTGDKTYMTRAEFDKPANKLVYELGPAIADAGQNRFLTVSGTRAVELKLSEGLFDSERDLLARFKVDRIQETRQTWVDSTVFFLNRPFVTGLLLIIGLVGLYLEFAAPGISVAGLTSLACFSLFFWSHALGGTSGWLEVILFALGIGCIGIEFFVLPGFGVFGLTGAILIVLSLVMASQDFMLPTTGVQWATLRFNLLLVLGAVALVTVALVMQLMFFDSIPGLNRFRLSTPDEELVPVTESITGLTSSDGLAIQLPALGDIGKSESVLRPAGKVRFGIRLIDVVTEGDFLDPGVAVEVVKREGNRIVVRKIS